jgi:DNA-binding transcriptional ArsR family regulator
VPEVALEVGLERPARRRAARAFEFDPVERLVERPQAVTELASGLPVSRPAVSQHLKVLKDAGLVVDRQAGKHRIYQVNPDGLGALRSELDLFWSKTLAAYKTVVEQRPEEVQ